MGRDRETFKHAAIYSFAAVLGKFIGFIMLPVYAHVLRDIGYGIIGMIGSTLTVLQGMMAYGLRGAIIRIYHEEEEEHKRRVISTGVTLVAAIAGSLVLLTMLVSRPLSHLLLGDRDHALLMNLALAAFFCDLTAQAAGAILLIERRSIYFSAIALLHLVLGLSLNIYLILVRGLGLYGYFLATLLTAVPPCLIFVGISIRKCGIGFDRRIARKLIRFQLPLVPSSLISTASRQAERVLVRFMISIESVGVLSMGYKFPVLLNMFIHEPFMKSWNTERIAIAEQPGGPERIGRMFTYFVFLMALAGLVLAVAMKDILMLLTPPEFWPAYRIARIEILTVILMASSLHLNFGILYAKDTKTWAVIRSVTAVIKIAFSVLFISLWGLYGAAYSACAVALITMLWGMREGQARYRIALETRRLLILAAAALGLFVLLTNVDFRETAALRGLAAGVIPPAADLLGRTFLGTWKEGKAVALLQERGDLLLNIAAKGLLAALYAGFFPLVHEPSRRRLQRWLRRFPRPA